MSFEFTWEDNNAICFFQGSIYLNDLVESSNYLIGSHRFDSIRYLIFDLSEVERYCLDKNDIRIISNIDKGASRWNTQIKMAIIVNNLQGEKIVKEYIKLMSETNWEIEIFESLSEAKEWCIERKN